MPWCVRATRDAPTQSERPTLALLRLVCTRGCACTQELLEFGLGDAASLLVLLFHRITRSQGCAVGHPSIKLVIHRKVRFFEIPASPDRDFTALEGLLLKSRLAVDLSLAIYDASAQRTMHSTQSDPNNKSNSPCLLIIPSDLLRGCWAAPPLPDDAPASPPASMLPSIEFDAPLLVY